MSIELRVTCDCSCNCPDNLHPTDPDAAVGWVAVNITTIRDELTHTVRRLPPVLQQMEKWSELSEVFTLCPHCYQRHLFKFMEAARIR